ncbi:phosphate/phosphite/phosphonate ABC transporter substrate-binding protein [Geomonas subterranea]|uniref:Phosphate/phosphite/phosphonate ABC transporter substrate-binding protein n=1 Tax=Geomonas subterranea TaxID=2847989 RepID=A0ABX8LJ77_9BACT|nr:MULTISPECIES: phosphate/phosphite/phosphonate ABC transporter substrate-binding protein [Geomonas]QXE91987.1 phosphate/phosphite/phosphonate ABC transporter substrate-binding protein [Geomonas subterranea]QXM09920.1 phosphate/phosphite/phosphonate ABC transporter substrate-binding protein [Geomonas subterranea]
MSRFRFGFFTLAMAILFATTLPRLVMASEKGYTLAVVPNLPAVTLHKNWTPIADYLSRELGVKVELKLYDKITTFLEETRAGNADFMYAAPNMFYLAYQKQKYIPLVRGSNMLRGQVFVRKDSPYTKVKDLEGQTIAIVGPKNVCSVITRHALLSGNNIDFNVSFSGSTINVAKSVLVGKAAAGATLDSSMMEDAPEMQKEFRVIMQTEKIPPHPFSAHPRIPKKVRDAVTTALLNLDKSDQGRKMLEAVKLVKPVRADYKRDYSFFANVDFERLDKQQPK